MRTNEDARQQSVLGISIYSRGISGYIGILISNEFIKTFAREDVRFIQIWNIYNIRKHSPTQMYDLFHSIRRTI